MDVAVVYNFAEHPGGGDYVALNTLITLREAGYNVILATSKPSNLEEAAKYYDERTPDIEVLKINVPKFLHHPYTIAFIAEKLINKMNLDNVLLVVFDDIPKILKNYNVLCYVNYSHCCRIRRPEYADPRYREKIKYRVLWYMHSLMFPRFFIYTKEDIGNRHVVLANSTLTYTHLKEDLGVDRIEKLYPPVDSQRIVYEYSNKHKENLIVSVGRIERNKRFEDILQALAIIKRDHPGISEVKCMIMGFEYDTEYLSKLKKTIVSLGLNNTVKIYLNVPRHQILENLAKAKIYVHSAPYEHFGISVVEAMAAGAIPIVKKGFNGPWIDILDQGKYGLGYETPENLAHIIAKILVYNEQHLASLRKRAIERAKQFDKTVFKQFLLRIIEKYFTCLK